ncbi:hypothetical protein NPIL_134571 [Nephila pilipes]|uniref:Major facilitator superfamily (MFS) profile domain-containing protein n=1 Tax=Nephila pilipes TaxID=299642 RepID=A0A8X6QW79_NEPPI|nr:hypothetical protein NPIL_134571 [Nephila pilipes]
MARRDVPDSARSWAIALAACVINVLLSGITRATGHIYVALIDTYGVSRFQANLPFTVRNIVRNLGGPLVGALGQRFGCRNVTLMGGIFAFLGVLLCAFAPSIAWIIFLWGGIHGLGAALGNTLSQVVVTQYFVKYRATASGLAFSGTCFGSLVLPGLVEFMLDHLGLSGAFLVSSGILMHVLPAALIIKEPAWVKGNGKTAAKFQTLNTHMTESKVCQNVLAINFRRRYSSENLEQNQEVLQNNLSSNLGFSVNAIDNVAFTNSECSVKDIDVRQVKVENSKQDNFLTLTSVQADLKTSISEEQKQETSLYRAVLEVTCDPMFHMISLSLAASAMLLDPLLTVIVDFIMDKGFEEKVAKYFISALAFGDLVGRLSFGWITDRNYMSVPKYMMLTQVLQGICFMSTCLLYEFYSLMIMITAVGMIAGATIVMYPILVGKYLPSVQSMAVGCMSFFTGMLTFTVPSLIGYFRDEVGSYNGMFYITGGSSVIVGFVWILEPLLLKLRRKVERRQNSKTEVSS